MILWLQDKVEVLEYYNSKVRSPSKSFNLPSVIRLKKYFNPYKHAEIRFCRENVYLRDNYTCQYCEKIFSSKALTLDHVIPLSKGGPHTWTNVVAACAKCNNVKGDKSLKAAGLKLPKKPVKPTRLQKHSIQRNVNGVPISWSAYLA